MNSIEVRDLLDRIAAAPGKNDKQAMVSAAMSDSLFMIVCEYAYNPFKTYGLRQIPERITSVYGGSDIDADFNGETIELLDELRARALTGNAAKVAVASELARLDEASADLLTRIIRKDLRAGFSESTINKASKGLIPEFPYMRCSLPKDAKLAEWPWGEGVVSQEKADGMFANLDFEENGLISIRSRQGSEFPLEKFSAIIDEVRTRLVRGYQQHGEIVVMRDGVLCKREIGNGILNSVLNGGDFEQNEKPIYMMWDQIPLTSVVKKGTCATPYKERLGALIRQLKTVPGDSLTLIPTRVVKTLAEGYAHAAELMKQGKEGTVVKHPLATWKDGTSKEQVKLKLEFNVDLVITGIVPGRDGTKNEGRAGSFACESSDGLLHVDVTVKNEDMRDKVDANNDDFIGRIIAVTANDIMTPGGSSESHSLFLPRMSEAFYRHDKTDADSLDRIFAQKEAAIFGESLLKEAA